MGANDAWSDYDETDTCLLPSWYVRDFLQPIWEEQDVLVTVADLREKLIALCEERHDATEAV